MARPFIAPPATPPDVANALRRGFEAMLKDPEFRAAAQRYKLELNNPMTGEEVQALVEKLLIEDTKNWADYVKLAKIEPQ